jgi:hypothetical protein
MVFAVTSQSSHENRHAPHATRKGMSPGPNTRVASPSRPPQEIFRITKPPKNYGATDTRSWRAFLLARDGDGHFAFWG